MRHVYIVVALVMAAMMAAVFGDTLPSARAQDATPATSCPQTTEEENAALARRWHEEAINGRDLSVIDQIVSDDVIHHAGTFPDGVGPEAVKTVLGALLTGFPDVKHTIDDVLVDGDEVVIRWTAQGTQQGEFQGYAPTGKPATWTGINIFRIACGKIVEEWSEVDGLGRLAQLEAAASPTP
jgi:steroid delta-isomerase-like uncharacterized protein